MFVNDGSTDKTDEILAELENYNVDVICKKQNSGKSESIRIGMLHAIKTGLHQSIGFIDADGGISPQAFKEFLESYTRSEKEHFDAFWGSRISLSGRKIRRKKTRHLIGRLIAYYLSFGVNLPYDTQCGLKIFKNTLYLQNALSKNIDTKWFFDLELYVNFAEHSPIEMRVWEEPLLDWFDVPGSKISLNQFIVVLSEIFKIKRKLRKNSHRISLNAQERRI